MTWEQVSGICAILGVVALYYQFVYLPKKNTRDEYETVRTQFNISRSLVNKLITQLTNYATDNNAFEDQFGSGVTFRTQINRLTYLRDSELKTEMVEGVLKLKPSTSQCQQALIDVKKQIESFNQIDAYFHTYFTRS